MGTSYDKFLKKANAKAQQNRINRATRTSKKYGRGLGKSHKQYIAGDIVSSASNRAYGYKMSGNAPINQFTNGQDPYLYKKQQEGYDPYEFKYVYTGTPTWVKGGTSANGNKYDGFWSRNRLATDKEKELYKKTGKLDFEDADRDINYSVLRGHDAKADKFKDQLNTPVWDGLKVAKKRVENGSNRFEYLRGFLKDIVVDPVFDGLKTFDRYESVLLGGISGGIEESANLFEAIADPNIKIKDNVNFRRPIENFQSSMKESDKTGWGKSTGAFFDEASYRNFEKEKARIKNSTSYTEAHKKVLLEDLEEKQNGEFHKLFRNVTGFGMDVANPINLGTSVAKVSKKLLGDSADILKGIKNGTADVSMGIVPKHIREANQKKAMKLADDNMFNPFKPKTGADDVIDVLHETKPMNDLKIYDDYKLDGVLNQGYKNAMNNDVDKVIKSNPATQNLGKFLDDIKPQKSPIVDDFENLFEASDVPNSRLGKELFFKKIDNLPDRESDEVLDWLAEYNPKVYDEYISVADDVDNFANAGINVNKIKSKAYDQKIKKLSTANKKMRPKLNRVKTDSIKEENALDEIVRILEGDNTPKTYKNNIQRNSAFRKSIDDFSNNIFDNKVDIDEFSQSLQSIKGKDVPAKAKREFINNKLFGGNKVIAHSVSNSSMDGLINNLEDVFNLKKVTNQYLETGEILPVKLSDSTKKFLNIADDLNIKGNTVRGNKIDSPEDLLNVLVNSIYDRSKALTDDRYGEKLKLMAKEFGYEDYYDDIVYKIDDLTNELKSLDGLPTSKENLSRKLEISSRLKELKDIKKKRTKMWESIRNLPESNFDKYISEMYPHHMKGMNAYSPRATQGRVLENMTKNSDTVAEDVVNSRIEKFFEKRRKSFNDVVPDKKETSLEIAINKKAKSKNLDNKSLKSAHEFKRSIREAERLAEYNEKLVEFSKSIGVPLPKRTNAKVKLSKNQTLGSLPPVKENLDSLKKLIKKEVEELYTNPDSYAENKSMYSNLKKELIKGLRSYGVPDNAYFEKATNFRKLMEDAFPNKAIEKATEKVDDVKEPIDLVREAERNKILNSVEKHKPLSGDEIFERKLNRNKEGGTGTPKKGMNMNLQLLARKIDDMFDELGNATSESLSNVTKKTDSEEFVNGFDKFNQKLNSKPVEDFAKNTDEFVDEQEIYDIINKIGKKYGGEDIKPPSFETFKKEYKDSNPHMKYEDSKIYDIYKRWLNTWKKGLTVYNPGWHIQNFFQNKGQNYLALGKDAFGSQKNAKNLLNYLQGGVNKVEDVIDKKNGVIYSGDDLKSLVKRNKIINSQTNDIMESRGLVPFIETKVDNSKLMKKLGHSEDTARLYHFIKQLERGMSPEDATKSVNKYLFDYDKKSKFDKVVGDFIDPFWVFHKNYAKLLGKTTLENPSAINNILRSERSLENGVAESDKNDTATEWDKIQSPYGSFKDEKNGGIYDYLYKQNIMPRIQDAIPTNMDEVENKLNPILRLAMQESRNEGSFHNKIVDKDEAGWNEVTKEDRNKEIAMELNPFLNSLAKAVKKSNSHQEKADKGKQSQSTSDKQILLDWIEFITGNKGNYYKR